jgi:hypothetical protein
LAVVEHRGFRYEIRRTPRAGEWIWTVYAPVRREGKVAGDRFFAMLCAERVIDAWCRQHVADTAPAAAPTPSTRPAMDVCFSAHGKVKPRAGRVGPRGVLVLGSNSERNATGRGPLG